MKTSVATARLIATGAGVGKLPAPGTAASALTCLVYHFALSDLKPAFFVLLFLALLVTVIVSISVALITYRDPDPQEIVADEVVGQLLALAFCGPSWALTLVAFALFRLLDIYKPHLIGKLDTLPGTLGIVLDDLAAGAAAMLLTGLLALLAR